MNVRKSIRVEYTYVYTYVRTYVPVQEKYSACEGASKINGTQPRNKPKNGKTAETVKNGYYDIGFLLPLKALSNIIKTNNIINCNRMQ